jgi:hypothetical protein
VSVFNRKDRRDHKDFEGNFSPQRTQNNADGAPELLTGAHGVNGAGNFSPQITPNNADGKRAT